MEYAEKLIDVYKSIDEDYSHYTKELERVNQYQQDLLHTLEKEKFNASQGYTLAKMLSDNRHERRKIKNELGTLVNLKNQFVDQNTQSLNAVYKFITNKDETLTRLTKDQVYSPRVLETTDIKAVVNNFKSQSNDNIVRFKRTQEPIDVISMVDEDLYYCKFSKSKNKSLVKGESIENLDKVKLA